MIKARLQHNGLRSQWHHVPFVLSTHDQLPLAHSGNHGPDKRKDRFVMSQGQDHYASAETLLGQSEE